MKFSLLFFILSIVLKIASCTHKEFKKYIDKVSAKILVKTKNGKYARLFIFSKGKFSSSPGDHTNFDVALVWKNPKVGFATMIDSNDEASMKALAKGNLQIVGMSVYGLWFETGINLLLGRGKESIYT